MRKRIGLTKSAFLVVVSTILLLTLFPVSALATYVYYTGGANCLGFWLQAQNFSTQTLIFHWQVELRQNGVVVDSRSGVSAPIPNGSTYYAAESWSTYPAGDGWEAWGQIQAYTQGGEPTEYSSTTTIPLENCLPASLGDRTWYDANYDGIQDAPTDEPGIQGVVVELYGCGQTIPLGTTSTDPNGNYLFADLAPGSYYLKFIKPQSISVFTLQDQGGDDNVDSDANPITGETICTTLVAGEQDLSWDAGFYGSTPSAVELSSFTATADVRAIALSWETATELDNLGFNLYRAGSADGPWTQLNDPIIPSLVPPGSAEGAVYSFQDRAVQAGITYYYRLESLDLYGRTKSYGPASAAMRLHRRTLIRPRLELGWTERQS